jgi:hypothetical protein
MDLKDIYLSGLDSTGSGYGPLAGSGKQGRFNESSRTIKVKEILDQLSDYQFLKKG